MGFRETLREIARLTFPKYKGNKISICIAEHVDRHEDERVSYIDWLVDLDHVQDAGPNIDGAKAGERYVLPLSSGIPILPGQSAQLTARSNVAFRVTRLVIANAGTLGGTSDWLVNDISIGNRSQFLQVGDLPGDLFATDAIDAYVAFETISPTRDVQIIVMYIGSVETGAPFFASLFGNQTTASSAYVRLHRLPQPLTIGAKIPLGFACVSQRSDAAFHAETSDITISIPPIDQATIDVAIDATLTAGEPTLIVASMIDHALNDRGGLVRDAYVAFIGQQACALAAGET